MNRFDFRRTARMRLREARELLRSGFWDGSYYFSGLTIECALKACIARRTKEFDFPPARKVVEQCYQHDLSKLVAAAELETPRNAAARSFPDFETNRGIVKNWSSEDRYKAVEEQSARAMYNAIVTSRDGVLWWIKRYW